MHPGLLSITIWSNSGLFSEQPGKYQSSQNRFIFAMFYRAYVEVLYKAAPAADREPIHCNHVKMQFLLAKRIPCDYVCNLPSPTTSQKPHPLLHPFNKISVTASTPNTDPNVTASFDRKGMNRNTNKDSPTFNKFTWFVMNYPKKEFFSSVLGLSTTCTRPIVNN